MKHSEILLSYFHHQTREDAVLPNRPPKPAWTGVLLKMPSFRPPFDKGRRQKILVFFRNKGGSQIILGFLAVQDSSIGDLVTH